MIQSYMFYMLPLSWWTQNAMRATMELYGDAMEYPSIHAQVALGTEDLTVKVKQHQNSPVKMKI